MSDRRAELIARELAKPGLRGHINAMCIYCIFDPDGGGGSWRQQVEACTAPKCPLFNVRARSEADPKGGGAKLNTVAGTGGPGPTEEEES